ncbi:WhiB family transcriptional regulator [Streptomyces violaceusniger]|uniref:4Fe-4S Wbl-type domain-containing protein n=1 Tax=Streptomyces violaceusniger TaxID=68280 RepID=A0A4D4LR86_STRVO|nr:hypothetical protein SVIO_112160 [Streptomyces violaceusniger]
MTTRLAPYPWLTGDEPCRQPDSDPEWWFTDDTKTEAHAHQLCQACPARIRCLAWALDNPAYTEHGIWAATDPERREELRAEFSTGEEQA